MLGYAGVDVYLYGYCLDDPINFVDRNGLQGRSEKDDEEESENLEHQNDKSSKSNNDSITGMDRLKENQALGYSVVRFQLFPTTKGLLPSS